MAQAPGRFRIGDQLALDPSLHPRTAHLLPWVDAPSASSISQTKVRLSERDDAVRESTSSHGSNSKESPPIPNCLLLDKHLTGSRVDEGDRRGVFCIVLYSVRSNDSTFQIPHFTPHLDHPTHPSADHTLCHQAPAATRTPSTTPGLQPR